MSTVKRIIEILNHGSELFLWVHDTGKVLGVDEAAISQLKKDFDITDNTNLVPALYLRKQSTYLERDQRISLRDHIFREVISNLLIHREYSSPFPSKFIIEKEKIHQNSRFPYLYFIFRCWSNIIIITYSILP